MFASEVPCSMAFQDPPCLKLAGWIAYFVHEENAPACETPEPLPLCAEHKLLIQQANHPFWRVWIGAEPTPCSYCGVPIRLDRFEVIS